MRSHGVAGSARGLGLSDHICWTFGSERERREFRTAAVEFAGDGLDMGQRLLYLVDDDDTPVLADLAALADPADLRRSGRLVVRRREQTPAPAPGPDPDAPGLVAEALADGFRGVRVVAERAGPVVAPVTCAENLAVELSIDRLMAGGQPCAALCGYDRRLVGEDDAAALACVHPLRHDPAATFSLYAESDRMCLEGEIDVVQVPWFERALASLPDENPLVLDASELRFVDAAGVGALAEFAARRQAAGAKILVYGARPVFRRVWDLLGHADIAALAFV